MANLGFVLQLAGLLILLPIAVAFYYGERRALISLFLTATGFLGSGFLLNSLAEKRELEFWSSSALLAAKGDTGLTVCRPAGVVQDHHLARPPDPDIDDHFFHGVDLVPVDFRDYVLDSQTCLVCRALPINGSQFNPGRGVLHIGADHGVGRLALLDQQVGNGSNLIDRDCEAEPDASA